MKRTITFLSLFLLLCTPFCTLYSQAIRVEPTFWWVGMNNPTLQLMLYGENMGKKLFSIDYEGVTLQRVERTDNPNVAFLYLHIDPMTPTGSFQIEVRDKGVLQEPIVYTLKEREKGAKTRPTFTAADNVYLLMPDRFANGDTTNDSVMGYHQGVKRSDRGARHGGDIEGIIQRIPYLADLGITALWTTPLFDNNDLQYSYHHYACTDYYKIDPRLGSNEDYLRLSKKGKAYGIKTIIDVVPNHCGGEHWWVKDPPAHDWFNTWKRYTSSNYRMTAWTDPYASDSDRHRLVNGWFAPNMPDLNLDHPLLFDYIKQVYIYWIEYAQIDGMRVDTYPYNPLHRVAALIYAIRDEYPTMHVVGECWVKTPAEIAYYQSGTESGRFDSGLQSVMDFVLRDRLTEVFDEEEGWESGTAKLYAHFAQDFVYPNPYFLMNFLDNHDIDRYATMVDRDVRKFKMGLALICTTRGYPQIYAGTEIMIDGEKGSYEGHRFDFPGGWATDKRDAFTQQGRTDEENEVFDYLKALLHLRKNTPALQTGKMKQFIPENGLYVYFRYDESETIMMVCNNNEEKSVLETERFAEMLTGYRTATEQITGQSCSLDEGISVEGKTVFILKLNQ